MPTKTYKELFSTHDDYDPLLNTKLQLLYQGGFSILENAGLFLERLPQLESKQAYESRLKAVAYIPYLSEFITQFSASLFSETLEVKEQGDASDSTTAGEAMTDDFYKEFLEACDAERRTFHQFAQDLLEKALSELCAYVTLDFPRGERFNRAYERANKLDRGYACCIPYNTVIDWKIDDATGKFIWTKEFESVCPNDDPMTVSTHYYQFRIRKLMPGKDGKMYGGWEVWKSELMPLDKECTERTKFTLDPKETVITSFPEVNLWKLCIKKAYHVGQQIGSLCQEHYQRRSFMVANANKTCVGLGVVTLGPEIGAPGDSLPMDIEVPQEPRQLRKKLESDGWVVLRQTDKWKDSVEIVEAEGKSHEFISKELERLVEAMMQTLRQMQLTAAANKKALGRSAQSKMMDQHGTSMLLSVYDRVIKDFTKMLFTCLAAGRGEDIRFTVEGLSLSEPTFDRQDTVTELSTFGVDVMKFPDLWKFKYLNQKASELLDNNLTDKERMELEDKFQELIDAGQFSPADPQADGYGTTKPPSSNSKMSSDGLPADRGDDSLGLGPGGQPLMPEGHHLQTGEHTDPQEVFNQLSQDYDKKNINWVNSIPWRGPVEVPLSSIDFSNASNWQASKDQDHVDKFVNLISNEGFAKPIILVNQPHNDKKMIILDGHHRALAYQKVGQPALAYIGEAGQITPEMARMHSQQNGSSNQKSTQTSNQKSQEDRLSDGSLYVPEY